MKEFICPHKGCGSKLFIRSSIEQTLVDFTREGAIEGHPFLEHMSTSVSRVDCYECQKRIPLDMARDIIKEVI